MKQQSVWQGTVNQMAKASFGGGKSYDAVIIGAGMYGVLTALKLKESGINAAVIEAETIGSGQTKNTTAKITSQHGVKYSQLIKGFGYDFARLYAEANENAIREYESVIRRYGIECDFEKTSAFLYSRLDETLLRSEYDAAVKCGIDACLKTKTCLPFSVKSALEFKNQAQFNPLKFLNSISQSVDIFEGTKAVYAEKNSVITNRGKIKAKYIIYACHFPFTNFPGMLFAKMHQERSYVIALKNAQTLDGMYYGIDSDGLSFRNYGALLLLGGGSHRTGKNKTGGKYDSLSGYAKKYYPLSEEEARWSAQDCITLDKIPYIGRLSKSAPNHFVATGFGKWGMTSSMAAAQIISDLICKGESQYEDIFSPARLNMYSARSFVKEAAHSVCGLAKGAVPFACSKLENLLPEHGGIVSLGGKKFGVYKDGSGVIYTVIPKCPHLGCQLEWNPDELSWDCPCHGSRFSYTGELIDNPAQKNLKKR